MIIADIVTTWVLVGDRNEMYPTVAYPPDPGTGRDYTDKTGQPDENLIPDPNAVVVRVKVDEATWDQMQADPNIVALWYETWTPELDELL